MFEYPYYKVVEFLGDDDAFGATFTAGIFQTLEEAEDYAVEEFEKIAGRSPEDDEPHLFITVIEESAL